MQEELGQVLGIGAAAAVPERVQPRPGLEPVGQMGRARQQPGRVPVDQRLAQRHDLTGLLLRRPPYVVEDIRERLGLLRQERVQGIKSHAGSPNRLTTAMASFACTSTTSPGAATTRATLTSSGPASVSTI